MTDAKIEFSIGSLSFSGQGSEKWLTEQLDKIIEAVPSLSDIAVVGEEVVNSTQHQILKSESSEKFNTPLASHIKSKGGDRSQNDRFLATADWLRRRGNATIITTNVTKALSENQQKRLSNPSDALNQNVKKGFCEKNSEGFFITPDGLKHLGYD